MVSSSVVMGVRYFVLVPTVGREQSCTKLEVLAILSSVPSFHPSIHVNAGKVEVDIEIGVSLK